jgi:hypothetical protein
MATHFFAQVDQAGNVKGIAQVETEGTLVDVTALAPASRPQPGYTTPDGGTTWVAPSAVTSSSLEAQRAADEDPSGGELP